MKKQANQRYYGQIALTKFKSAVISVNNKQGKPVRGVFIPIEANHLYEGNKHIYASVGVTMHDRDQYENDGFISQQVSADMYKKADDQRKEEFNNLPILGNVKKSVGVDSGSDDFEATPKVVSDNSSIDDSDDMPF
jgi:hypothetical protein